MHDDVRLGGVVWVFAEGLMLLGAGLALFVVIDALRRRGRDGDGPVRRSTLVGFATAQAFFLFLMLVVQFTSLPPIFSAALLLLVPLAIGLGITYLLLVVFPAHPVPAEEASGESDAGPEDDGSA